LLGVATVVRHAVRHDDLVLRHDGLRAAAAYKRS
jgi:hypothetical protein